MRYAIRAVDRRGSREYRKDGSNEDRGKYGEETYKDVKMEMNIKKECI